MLLAAYSFNESGNTIVDYSGNGNDFSIASTGSIRTVNGWVGGGLTSTSSSPPGAILPDIGRTAQRTIMLWERNINQFTDHWPIIFNVATLSSGAWGILSLGGNICIQARDLSGFVRAQATEPSDSLW